jgi:hypothetical protein
VINPVTAVPEQKRMIKFVERVTHRWLLKADVADSRLAKWDSPFTVVPIHGKKRSALWVAESNELPPSECSLE